MSETLTSLSAALAKIYGPRPVAYGTYERLTTFVEALRYETRRAAAGKAPRGFEEVAASVGVAVESSDHVAKTWNRPSILLELVRGKRLVPAAFTMSHEDVRRYHGRKGGKPDMRWEYR